MKIRLLPRSSVSRSLALLLLVLPAAVASAQTPRAMTLIEFLNVPRLADPQLSPDGRQIVFVRSDADWRANRRVSHIWRVNADGSGLQQMTSGTEGESSPRWSPDGKTIAFIARRGTGEGVVSQIY